MYVFHEWYYIGKDKLFCSFSKKKGKIITYKTANAFQTKMWHSNLEKFRGVLVFDSEKVCVSDRFWLIGRRKRSVQLSPAGTTHPV